MKETTILLTGAGFTHNFGTPLAKEMWAEIFNSKGVQNFQNLRIIMLDKKFEYNYENIYHHVLNIDSFLNEEKDANCKSKLNT